MINNRKLIPVIFLVFFTGILAQAPPYYLKQLERHNAHFFGVSEGDTVTIRCFGGRSNLGTEYHKNTGQILLENESDTPVHPYNWNNSDIWLRRYRFDGDSYLSTPNSTIEDSGQLICWNAKGHFVVHVNVQPAETQSKRKLIRVNQPSRLDCNFDSGNVENQIVRYHLGFDEIFRYTRIISQPTETTTVNPVPRVDVNLLKSNEKSIEILLSKNRTGNMSYSCSVTTSGLTGDFRLTFTKSGALEVIDTTERNKEQTILNEDLMPIIEIIPNLPDTKTSKIVESLARDLNDLTQAVAGIAASLKEQNAIRRREFAILQSEHSLIKQLFPLQIE